MTTLAFTRTDTSIIGRWWWTVDRVLLAAILVLMVIGALLLLAAGPAAAQRIHASSPYHFIARQAMFLPLAVIVLFAVSLAPVRVVRRIGALGFAGSIVLLALLPLIGTELKGAARWFQLGPLSLQPSEFVKPTFAVMAGWMFSQARAKEGFPGLRIATVLYLLTAGLIVIQPDFGQTMVLTAMWGAQFFLAGLPVIWVAGLAALGLCGAFGAYKAFPHVQSRVDSFLNPHRGDTYQIRTALDAFRDGGIFGRGPGEGEVKAALPDAHTDFIFAVAGEEYGVFLCLFMVGLFAFISIRAMSRALTETSLFALITVGGLSAQFALQALINMASSLHMTPTKGMTLPFVSYGGSSLLGLALGMGMILALTRRRACDEATTGERR